MAISFPRVEEVVAGRLVSARHAAQLARAINARILSGLGDGAWRYVFWWLSAVRQIRNPDGSGLLFPAAAEMLRFYQHVEPRLSWPDSGPGEPEGINLASIAGAFVFGGETAGLDSEDVRLTDPLAGGVPLEAASTPEEIWELGKAQRGAYDPETGLMGAPAWQAAQEHYGLVQSPTSPHGNSYGGWFPTPVPLGECEDGGEGVPNSTNYEIRFTRISDGSVRTYPGTCPEDPTHVARVVPWSMGWYVIRYSGAVEYLPRSEWIEGPYSGGGVLRKAYGEHMPRILNRFVGEFRGDQERHAAELAGRATVHGRAFDIRSFLTRQYLLAPAFGRQLAPDTVSAEYPTRSISGASSASPGTRIGSVISIHPGFVASAFAVKGFALREEAVVELRSGATVVGRVTLTPEAPFAIAVLAAPASGDLQVVLPDGVRFVGSSGGFRVEVAEIWEYKPQAHDLMLVCRLGGARADGPDGTDGSGLTEEDAKEIWRSYSTTGCILRRRSDQFLPGSLGPINSNAVFDLLRRWSRTARVIPRTQFAGYAVEDGKSILWIDPFPYGASGSPGVDCLEGIRDAIAPTATARGWSNRWCLFTEFARYQTSGSSIWSPDVLADWVALTDRCAHWTPMLPQLNIHLQRHFSPGSDSAARSYTPEVASGYRYAKNLNQSATEGHYRSCRIYEPPIEIESAETVTVDGRRLVKVTLTGRLHHHHDLAPSSISSDVSSWDRADLTAEAADYRTPENALREYLVNQLDPTYQCEKAGPGNAAAGSDILFDPDVPWGACYPNIFLVQMMPEPYLDGNDSDDDLDSVMTHEQMSQAELWLRVFSEGCVDGETTIEYGCQTGINAVFDYRWETLCFKATGTPWIKVMPSEETADIRSRHTRPDEPMAFGPIPTTWTVAEIWNQYARICNALTDYRVMLPWKLEARTLQDERIQSFPALTAEGDPVDCPGSSSPGFVWSGDPGDVVAGTETMAWTEVTAVASSTEVGFGNAGAEYTCDGTRHNVFVKRIDQEYRFALIDPDAIYAIPEAWRDQIQTDGRMLATEETRIEDIVAIMSGGEPNGCNGVEVWTVGGVPIEYRANGSLVTVCGIYPASGRVSLPAPGRVTIIGANDDPICNEGAANVSTNTRILGPIPTDSAIFRVPLTDPDPTT